MLLSASISFVDCIIEISERLRELCCDSMGSLVARFEFINAAFDIFWIFCSKSSQRVLIPDSA